MTSIQYYCYPRTETPPHFAEEVTMVFRDHEDDIATEIRDNGLKSDEVLGVIREDLFDLGFQVETGKSQDEKIHRPVLFGKDGDPQLRYEVDGYHPEWKAGIEVEAGRAWKGNAIYRDLVQAAMMVRFETLILAVPNVYKHSGGRQNPAFRKTNDVLDTLFATERFELPYGVVLIGY